MRVLQISNHHKVVGGSDTAFFNTIDLLRTYGHTVVPFSSKAGGDVPTEYSDYFPKSIPTGQARFKDFLKYVYNPEARRNIRSLIEVERQFDVAHLHIYYGQLTASILPELKGAKIRVVQSLHDLKFACPVYTMVRNDQPCDVCVSGSKLNAVRYRCKRGRADWSIAALVEYYSSRLIGDLRHVDMMICVSDFQKRLLERAGVPGEKLVRLYNFVEPAPMEAVTGKERADYLLYVGRLEKIKGVGTLVDAAKRCGKRLIIAGTGSQRESIERSVSDCGWIECVGFVSGGRLTDLIENADAVVQPSECYELCPMSVLEAKSRGVPVIGADIGGIPELIRDEEDGFIFRSGDRESLIDAIRRLERSDRQKLGQAAYSDVLKRFSGEEHLRSLLKIYSGEV